MKPIPITDIFAALGNPARLRILDLLRTGPRASGDIAAVFDLSRAAVAEHLRVLRLAGLVREQANGRYRIYHVDGAGLSAARKWLGHFELSRRVRMRPIVVDEEDA